MIKNKKIKVYCNCTEFKGRAEELAKELNLELTNSNIDKEITYITVNEFNLGIKNSKISQLDYVINLVSTMDGMSGCNVKKHPLAKAIGVKNKNCTIYDLTAGFLKDSLFFSYLGHKVTAIEANPIIFKIINAANNVLIQNSNYPEIKIINAECSSFLNSVKEQADIIYLDPMFPKSNKSALAKKSMQFLQAIVTDQKNDYEKILKLALEKSRKKVIVKRPYHGPFLTNLKPCYQVSEKQSCRYDIYQTRSAVDP